MTTLTIRSPKNGDQTFTVPDQGGPVCLEDGRQLKPICYGGYLRGNIITADADTLAAAARKWRRQYLKNERA